MPTPTSANWRLADLVLEGTLEAKIRDWRTDGSSWEEIARLIWAETDRKVVITGAGVARWARQLGIEPEPTEAAS